MYLLIIVTFFLPVLLWMLTLRKTAILTLWAILSLLVFIFASLLGLGWNWATGGEEWRQAEKIVNFPIFDYFSKDTRFGGLMGWVFILPWAMYVDTFVICLKLSFVTKSIAIIFWQLFGLLAVSFMFGLVRQAIQAISTAEMLRRKAVTG